MTVKNYLVVIVFLSFTASSQGVVLSGDYQLKEPVPLGSSLLIGASAGAAVGIIFALFCKVRLTWAQNAVNRDEKLFKDGLDKSMEPIPVHSPNADSEKVLSVLASGLTELDKSVRKLNHVTHEAHDLWDFFYQAQSLYEGKVVYIPLLALLGASVAGFCVSCLFPSNDYWFLYEAILEDIFECVKLPIVTISVEEFPSFIKSNCLVINVPEEIDMVVKKLKNASAQLISMLAETKNKSGTWYDLFRLKGKNLFDEIALVIADLNQKKAIFTQS